MTASIQDNQTTISDLESRLSAAHQASNDSSTKLVSHEHTIAQLTADLNTLKTQYSCKDEELSNLKMSLQGEPFSEMQIAISKRLEHFKA
jgi:chromosome segregation ATPase